MMMDLSVARRLAPEWLDVIQSRARVLRRIRFLQPIGRRALALEMGITERILRGEVDFLKQQGLITAQAAGMSLTDEGYALLDEVEPVVAVIEGRAHLSQSVSRLLDIPEVLVVSGDSDEDQRVKDALGYEAAVYLRSVLRPDDVLAVTGGTTLAAMASQMPDKGEPLPIRVVPARGGLGETVSAQANTIASDLAVRLGGTSIMLHVPDRLSEVTLARLIEEPMVRERLAEVRQATVIVHGIGGAMKMARRRQLDDAEIAQLERSGAVAEAFGYYFDALGRTVFTMSTVGLRQDDLRKMRLVIGVAGGCTKAKAIAAAAKAYRMDVLVTDEGAARALLDARPSAPDTPDAASDIAGKESETRAGDNRHSRRKV